ncbi:hypothetical protein ES708_20632 [subsurface metagenome]
MINAAGTEKEQRLEEGMVKQVKNTDSHATSGQAQHHIAQLADGGISQNPLNIGHHQPHSGGKDSREATDNGYRGYRFYRMSEEREGASHQKDASSHHSCRMNQGADRSGAFHGIG